MEIVKAVFETVGSLWLIQGPPFWKLECVYSPGIGIYE
jgi:hypothetical protein